MYIVELYVLVPSVYFAMQFFKKWYGHLRSSWPPERAKLARWVLGCLPLLSLIVIFFTLRTLAAVDVVDSPLYILFYTIIGFAWLYLGLKLMTCLFDISWLDDALHSDNKAALFSIAGGFLGLTIIYAAANIGDGPGWWCVFFAGGLGLVAWILLAMTINLFTNMFERVTVDRDISCGIRFGFYLLASSIILGRASAGNWTSFWQTIVEFTVGWPALPLTALVIIIERVFLLQSNSDDSAGGNSSVASQYYLLTNIIAVTNHKPDSQPVPAAT